MCKCALELSVIQKGNLTKKRCALKHEHQHNNVYFPK